jgi:hypothetical protein
MAGDKKEKAEDFKSSAYTLLIVGVIGIIVLILIDLDMFPIKFVGTGKIMPNVVMGALFLFFIITGITSFKSSKELEKEAVSEDDLTEKIKGWVRENVTADSLKEGVYFEADTPDEMKYFKYSEILKTRISEKFGNVNPKYLDELCDELYSELFEGGEQ